MRAVGGAVAVVVAAMCVGSIGVDALAGQQQGGWTRFRGPNGSGVADVTGLPVEFGPDTNVDWKQPVPEGQSSPVLGTEHVFLTGVEEDVLVVLALDRETGELAWRRELEPGYEVEMYLANDAASPTPVTDGTNVYALFGDLGVVAFDAEGNELWRLPLGPFDNFYGTAASPVLAGDTLILLFDQIRGSYLLGVDRHSGEVRWRRERPGRVEGWATPVLYPSAEAPVQIVVAGSGFVDSYSIETGEPFWQLSGVGVLPVASPVLAGDVLLMASPDQGGYLTATFDALLAKGDDDGDAGLDVEEMSGLEEMAVWRPHFGYLDVDGDGVLERAEYEEIVGTSESDDFGTVGIKLAADGGGSAEVVWREQRSVPYVVSPIVYQGLAYLITDNGIVSVVRVEDGELVRRERLSRAGVNLVSSPVAADGKIYVLSADGEVFVLRAGADWEILATNDLGEPMKASPTLAPGRIYIRTQGHLYAFGSDER